MVSLSVSSSRASAWAMGPRRVLPKVPSQRGCAASHNATAAWMIITAPTWPWKRLVGGGGQVAAEAGLAVAVEDDEEQGPGVQVDASVESGLRRGLEVAHEGLRFRGMPGEAAGCPLHLRTREPK